MNKGKILRIILWLTFIPYLFLFVYSLYYAIAGYDVYTMILPQYVRTIYGWDAFLEVFVWTGLALCLIPILPICFLYQSIVFIIVVIRRTKEKKLS